MPIARKHRANSSELQAVDKGIEMDGNDKIN